jgi:hypothetical protein
LYAAVGSEEAVAVRTIEAGFSKAEAVYGAPGEVLHSATKRGSFLKILPITQCLFFHSPGWKSVQVSSVRPILDFILSNNEFYYSQVRSNLASVIENLPQILTQAS